MTRSLALAALVLSTFATPALAQMMSPWYAGVSIGESRTQSELIANREATVVNAVVVGSTFDSRDTAFKAFLGYNFTPHVAVELNYADLGTSRLFTGILATGITGSVTMDRQIQGFGADVVVRAPMGPRASVFGRVGAVRSRLEADAHLQGNIVFTGGNTSERSRSTTVNETVGRYGLGFDFHFARGLGMRIEWERWLDVGKPFEIGGSGTTGEADTDLYSIGIVYRFR